MVIHNYIMWNCPNDPIVTKAVREDDEYTYEDVPNIGPQQGDEEEEERQPQAENAPEMEHLQTSITKKLKNDRQEGHV